ncbi:two-component system sensor histidine kinase NtrB [Aurantiacibacter aquimixticola]|uniref:histidine kinase n=1 Tax=Aurantiacibacter aquimixticola TaxID=1958945 RepID=A0A419RRM1_9SPHN|nr:ATP-binding protein [Aurantiacibacter aquimixticola]RJY08452.1 PAS domain-containing sensor histidine kinase [Aurantiacibacter aquimixticola]
MSDTAPGSHSKAPGARDQIGGLSFALLLLAPDLSVVEANPAAEDLLGISAARLADRRLLDIVSIDDARTLEGFGDPEAQLVARALDLGVGERVLRVNLTISPLGTHPGWRIVTLSDAAQGERFEEQARRPALRGPAVLAHEIKNPLSAIRGAAQLLAKKSDESELNLTSLIADEVDRIAALVDRMQRLGREQSEPVAPVNLHHTVRRALDTVRLTSPETLTWREEFDPSLPPVLANEGALAQVLVNLLSNARDAASEIDVPEVMVRTRFVSGLVMNVIRLGRPVRLPIEVQVSDNGAGLDPALADHIFEPFVSSKANGQGLGLALVQKLVRDMDGRVSHERDERAGWTHFRVHLPMATREEAA